MFEKRKLAQWQIDLMYVDQKPRTYIFGSRRSICSKWNKWRRPAMPADSHFAFNTPQVDRYFGKDW